jgi:hypothetical protein
MTVRRRITGNREIHRFYLDGDDNGDNWIDVLVDDGKLILRSSGALNIRPWVANVAHITNAEHFQ